MGGGGVSIIIDFYNLKWEILVCEKFCVKCWLCLIFIVIVANNFWLVLLLLIIILKSLCLIFVVGAMHPWIFSQRNVPIYGRFRYHSSHISKCVKCESSNIRVYRETLLESKRTKVLLPFLVCWIKSLAISHESKVSVRWFWLWNKRQLLSLLSVSVDVSTMVVISGMRTFFWMYM